MVQFQDAVDHFGLPSSVATVATVTTLYYVHGRYSLLSAVESKQTLWLRTRLDDAGPNAPQEADGKPYISMQQTDRSVGQ